MRYIYLLLCLVCSLSGVLTHSDFLSTTSAVNCSSYPLVQSYHVHITYMLTSSDQISRAGALRDEALLAFSYMLGADPICPGTASDPSGRYDNGRLCMIYDHSLDTTLSAGPFPIGEWSMFIPVHYYGKVVPWFVQHRGEFSLLVHPNTGCEYEDHGIWAQWSGDKWNLDMSIFKPLTQTASFNQTRGTPENPVCLPSKSVCASSEYPESISFAPEVVCCFDMSCQCSTSEKGVCYCL